MNVTKLLHHFFVPHIGNNFRAKLIHNSTLSILAAAMVFTGFSSVSLHRAHPEVLGIAYQISTDQLLNDTNQDRAANGLPPLSMNAELTQAAQAKAADMFAKNYWAHFAPDGSTTPWMFIKDAGYSYIYAGENLAKGYTTSDSVVQAWMNSPTHRENMLSKNYKDVGFAVVPGRLQDEDTVLVVEMFGSTSVPEVAAATPEPVQPAVVPQVAVQSVPTKAVAQPTQAVIPTVTVMLQQIPVKPAPAEIKSVTPEPKLSYSFKPLFNAASISTRTTTVIFVLLILAFSIDIVVVERKQIPRFVGHNLDHIFLLTLFLLVIVFGHVGGII